MSIFIKGVTAGLTTSGQHLYQLLIGDTAQDVSLSLPLRQVDYARLVALISVPKQGQNPPRAVEQPAYQGEDHQQEFLEMDNPVQAIQATRTRPQQEMANTPFEEPDLGESMAKEIQLDNLPRMPRPGRALVDMTEGQQEVDFGGPLDFGN